jgi:hypothetical protein
LLLFSTGYNVLSSLGGGLEVELQEGNEHSAQGTKNTK